MIAEHHHDHPHDHGDHEHHHVGQGPVMLDIGDGYGALVVTLGEDTSGSELHVRRPGDSGTTHTGVWEREVGGEVSVVAVFRELTVGEWDVLDPGGAIRTTVLVEDGAVAQLDLR